jgi:hypothetical protein
MFISDFSVFKLKPYVTGLILTLGLLPNKHNIFIDEFKMGAFGSYMEFLHIDEISSFSRNFSSFLINKPSFMLKKT